MTTKRRSKHMFTKKIKPLEKIESTILKGKPFVKWVGGKGNLAKTIDAYLPVDITEGVEYTYAEPFAGGGGMVFYLLQKYPNIKRAIIGDINEKLISCYLVIKDYPEELIAVLKGIQAVYFMHEDTDYRKRYFEQRKKMFNGGDLNSIEEAATFIFLNKTCFNGLYRVNKSGKFNVPFGKYKNPVICDEEVIRKDSELLQRVDFVCGDYHKIIDKVEENENVLFLF